MISLADVSNPKWCTFLSSQTPGFSILTFMSQTLHEKWKFDSGWPSAIDLLLSYCSARAFPKSTHTVQRSMNLKLTRNWSSHNTTIHRPFDHERKPELPERIPHRHGKKIQIGGSLLLLWPQLKSCPSIYVNFVVSSTATTLFVLKKLVGWGKFPVRDFLSLISFLFMAPLWSLHGCLWN